MEIDRQMHDQMQRYMALHFIDYPTLVRRTGPDNEIVDALLEAGAAPGVIYTHSTKGWWSALGAYVGREEKEPPSSEVAWHNPGAVWWVRRALLVMRSGQSPIDAAANNHAHFMSGFLSALQTVEYASLAYPSCFDGDRLVTAQARETGAAEWRAWVHGAYGVCMRRFSADGCVAKEALRARITAALEDGSYSLDDLTLFDLTERLESLVLPFAPWERSGGTPGRAIDAPLVRLNLGVEEPY